MWGVEVIAPMILTLGCKLGEWSASPSGSLNLSAHRIGGLVGPRTGLEVWRKETFYIPAGVRTPNRRHLA